jgi:predicted PurR-regulated permease PerM
VVTFYLLKDWEKMLAGIQQLFPRSVESLWVRFFTECNEVLGAFFRGQLLVMLGLSIYYTIGLRWIGLDLALLIGLCIGLVSVVPYLGFIVGLVLALLTTALQFHDVWHLLYVLMVFAFGSILENVILAPWLVGDRIGLHPVAVIFAVLAGGQLFGFTGVLLALPSAAVIMVLVRYITERYMQSVIYNNLG